MQHLHRSFNQLRGARMRMTVGDSIVASAKDCKAGLETKFTRNVVIGEYLKIFTVL